MLKNIAREANTVPSEAGSIRLAQIIIHAQYNGYYSCLFGDVLVLCDMLRARDSSWLTVKSCGL